MMSGLTSKYWAAKGVPLRVPRKFWLPLEAQQSMFPIGSLMEMMVLLKEA